MSNPIIKNNSVVSLGKFDADKFAVSVSDYNYGLRQDWHKHNDFILAMTLKGYVREQVGSHDTLVKPLAVGVKSAEIRHTDYFWDKGVRVVKISLNESFFVDLKEKILIKDGWNWNSGSDAIRPFLRVADNLFHKTSDETEITEGIYEILASILPNQKLKSISTAPLWLVHAQQHLENSFAEGVRLTQLADEAGVHPVYFARQFRRFFGCSVGRYIRQLQFQKSVNLLTNSNNNLAEIAYQVGCSDQAHLSRIFINEFGVTLGHFRKLVK